MHARVELVHIQWAEDIHIINCTLSNAGGTAFSINGANSSVTNSVVENLGCSALTISGGDAATLQHSGHKIMGNTISNYALFTRTYNGGINFYGTGSLYSHNKISKAPHTAIIGQGAENIFEYNIIENVCREVDDAGAWYSGRSWTTLGNVIRNNLFKNIIHDGNVGVVAVYLDDLLSSHIVTNNTFMNCTTAVVIGGGRNNIVTGNHFYDIVSRAVHVDARGVDWALDSYCGPGGSFNNDLDALNYKNPPYSTHYPQLLNVCKCSFSIVINYLFDIFLSQLLTVHAVLITMLSNGTPTVALP